MLRLTPAFLATLVLVLFFPTSCAVNPVTGKKELMFMSEEKELALGKQYDPAIVAQFGAYPDETLQQFISSKGKEMVAVSHRSNLDFTFRVLDSPVINAFALPGGYVYFTRGILAHFNNEAQFAGVLGHEIGHVTARHGAQQQTQQMLGQVGLMAGTVAGSILTKSDISNLANQAAQGLQLLFLKFSRDDESQSDRLGVEYATRIGYNSHEMAGFFSTLHRVSSKGGQAVPTFLSTHPDPLDREQNVHRLSEQWQSKLNATDLKVNRDSYLRMIDGIIYGADPRQGYTENNTFYHPELKFQFDYAVGWELLNSPSNVQIIAPEGKALIEFNLAQGESPQAAVQGLIEKYQFQVQSQNGNAINGLPAYSAEAVYNDEQNQQQLGILITAIQYGEYLYQFMGITTLDQYPAYQAAFARTSNSFAQLNDPNKINVQPERIKVREISRNGTLRSALQGFGMPAERLEELAILNGMELGDAVQRGMLIKTVEKKE